MRQIDYIAVHCTASPQTWGVKELEREFYVNKKWKNPGYHYVVTADGKIHQMLAVEKVSNGVKGYNHNSINVAYVGGVDVANNMKPIDNRTEAQKKSLLSLLKVLHQQYPKAKIQGHRDFPKVAKACPSFDAKKEYSNI
jgi:N-acetylmuramoyl-L-alanine amidase